MGAICRTSHSLVFGKSSRFNANVFCHVLEAIRIVFPGFASDFENEPSPNALNNIKKLTSAVAGIKNGFNFVLNNAATDNPVVADFSQALIDHLPDNVHLVIIQTIYP
jgi:hypothetical protein